MTEMTINKLPSKTWYWLKVNETKLPWDFEHTTELPEENISVGQEETARFSITGEGEYSSKKINIHAAKGETTTVFMDYAPNRQACGLYEPDTRGGRTHSSDPVAAQCRGFACIQCDSGNLREKCADRAGADLYGKRRYLFGYYNCIEW